MPNLVPPKTLTALLCWIALCTLIPTHPSHAAQPTPKLYKDAMTAKQQKKWLVSIKRLERFIKTSQSDHQKAYYVIKAYGNLMALHRKHKSPWKVRKKIYRRVVLAYDKLQKYLTKTQRHQVQTYPAESFFRLTMGLYARFVFYRSKSRNTRQQKRFLMRKIRFYRYLEKRLQRVKTYKAHPWTLCAYYYQAHGKEVLADTVDTMPLPRLRTVRWTTAARRIYRSRLRQRFSTPLRKKALKLYKTARRKAKRYRVKNRCARRLPNAIKRLSQKLNPKARKKPTVRPKPRTKPKLRTPKTKPRTKPAPRKSSKARKQAKKKPAPRKKPKARKKAKKKPKPKTDFWTPFYKDDLDDPQSHPDCPL